MFLQMVEINDMETFEDVRSTANNPKRSHAWQYFLQSNMRAAVQCKICNNVFQYANGQSTSNLTRHLRLQHKIQQPKNDKNEKNDSIVFKPEQDF